MSCVNGPKLKSSPYFEIHLENLQWYVWKGQTDQLMIWVDARVECGAIICIGHLQTILIIDTM